MHVTEDAMYGGPPPVSPDRGPEVQGILTVQTFPPHNQDTRQRLVTVFAGRGILVLLTELVGNPQGLADKKIETMMTLPLCLITLSTVGRLFACMLTVRSLHARCCFSPAGCGCCLCACMDCMHVVLAADEAAGC